MVVKPILNFICKGMNIIPFEESSCFLWNYGFELGHLPCEIIMSKDWGSENHCMHSRQPHIPWSYAKVCIIYQLSIFFFIVTWTIEPYIIG